MDGLNIMAFFTGLKILNILEQLLSQWGVQ